MDHYDCFLGDTDFKTAQVNSPGPSSGYASADDTHQVKFSSDPALFRDVDSPWRGQSPFMTLGSDPCMSGAYANSRPAAQEAGDMFDIRNSFSFDDLADPCWDPFGDVFRDFASTETLADVEMGESPRLGSALSRRGSGLPTVGSDSSLLSLLRGSDSGIANTEQGFTASTSNLVTGINVDRNARVFTQQNNYNSSKIPVRSGLTVSPPKSSPLASSRDTLTRTVSSIHQYMADMSDMGTFSDESDYILQFVKKSSVDTGCELSYDPVTASSKIQMQNSAILGSVFGQRSPVTSLRSCEPKALSRINGGAVASSCGSILRHSVTIPASLNQNSIGRSLTEYNFKNGFSSSSASLARDRSASSCDMKGGRITSTYPGLDDHRYTLKPVQSQSSKLSKQHRRPSSNQASNCSLYSMNGNTVRATSILEAFLRSTRPMDPNKGSNAALAAEGLSYLQLDERQKRQLPDQPTVNGCSGSGMLLKKLLTGEIDQREVLPAEDDEVPMIEEEEDELMDQDLLVSAPLPIDSPLTDGFGLGVDLPLDDSQIIGSLLGGDDGAWLNNFTELASTELDDILKEQTRQDDLWLQHYIDKLL